MRQYVAAHSLQIVACMWGAYGLHVATLQVCHSDTSSKMTFSLLYDMHACTYCCWYGIQRNNSAGYYSILLIVMGVLDLAKPLTRKHSMRSIDL